MKRLFAALLCSFGCDGALEAPAPPTPPAALHRLVPGLLGLVGGTGTGCSTGVARPGLDADLWCAFYQVAQGKELWVVNVSQAVTRPVACDGTSPHCLLLTSNLWTGDPLSDRAHPGIHGFEGDTLFLHADATSPGKDEPYKGPVRAWRPGWSAARALTSPEGYGCRAAPHGAAAYCLDGLAVKDQRTYEFDLRAGALGSSPGPLQLVTHVRSHGSRGQLMWQAGFSPDGAWFLHSSPADGEDVEVLRLFPTTDGGVGQGREIRRGGSRWQVAPDGRKLYLLDAYNYVDAAPAGTLTMVDFPAATNDLVLQPKVGDYLPLGGGAEPDRGLGFLQDMAQGSGTLRLQRDRTRPAQATTVEEGVREFLISPDLRFTFVDKPGAAPGAAALLVGNDGKGSCVLTEGRLFYSPMFSPDSNTIYWLQDSDNAVDIEGWYAPSGRCEEKRRFSTDIGFHHAVRGGLIYADVNPDFLTMVLNFVPMQDGVLAEESLVPIHPAADVSLARGGSRFLVFTVSRGEEPGLYAYGPF